MPEGVVASGVFSSVDGSTTGAVDVVVSGEVAEVVLRNFATTHDRLAVSAPLGRAVQARCVDGESFALGDVVPGARPDPLILPLSSGRGDPSFLTEVVVAMHTPPGDSGECINQVVAAAPLTWTFDPRRPFLAALLDGGARAGASGEPVVDGAGRPVAYVAAPDDSFPGVADRFGIRVDDVLYLNPARAHAEDPLLYVGEELNLDLRAR